MEAIEKRQNTIDDRLNRIERQLAPAAVRPVASAGAGAGSRHPKAYIIG